MLKPCSPAANNFSRELIAKFLFLFKNPDHIRPARLVRLVSLVNPCSCLRCTSPRNPFSRRNNTEANSSDSFSEKTISGPRLQELTIREYVQQKILEYNIFLLLIVRELLFSCSFLLYLILRNSTFFTLLVWNDQVPNVRNKSQYFAP